MKDDRACPRCGYRVAPKYGRYPEPDPKYYPDTMVQIDGRDGSVQMIKYGDLDSKYEWVEVTLGDAHPVFRRGKHWLDVEPIISQNSRVNKGLERLVESSLEKS